MPSHLLSVIIFLPLLGLPALLMLRSDDHTWIRRIALAVSLAEFVISLAFLLPTFDSANAGYQFVENHPWIGDAIQYHIGVDGISLFLVLLTTFLTPLAILCSWNSIHEYVKGFFVSLLVIETAMIGVFVSLDLFLFFVFWELTLIPMYFLIGIWGHTRRIYAAVKFILYTMFGSILMLVAILWLYNLSGSDASSAPLICPNSLRACNAATSRFRRTPNSGSSVRSSSRSRSKCRSSRCTPGCRTRTPKRPPPAP